MADEHGPEGALDTEHFLPPVRVPRPEPEERPAVEAPAPPPGPWYERRFWPAVAVVTAVAAAVRLYYVFTDHRFLIGGDGFDYHLSALRLADGLGFTRSVGDIGAGAAHHPPGWTTVLGAVSWLGARSVRDHQLVGVAFGLAVVVLAALVGRRYFNPRVGLIAACIAALYPGFWLLEGNMLSEPLGLALLGVVLLLVADLRDHPTFLRAAGVGAVSGLLALTRPEQVAVVVIIVVPLLLHEKALSGLGRLARIAVLGVVMIAVLAPWSLYNSSRFKEPVTLSTGDGGTMLAGNCAPGSFEGARMGFWDNTCLVVLSAQHPGLDPTQLDRTARDAAVDNIRDNSDRLPIVVPARVGRLLAVFRPSQTVDFVTLWMRVDTGLIWAWVASFWVILALAIGGAIAARRARTWTWPLIAPFVLVLLEMLIFYGEPRYHSMADLGLVVLAGFAIDQMLAGRRPKAAKSSPRQRSRPARTSPKERDRRLPSVHVSG